MRVLLCTSLLATTAAITPRGRRASNFRGGARRSAPCWTRLSGGTAENTTTYDAAAVAALEARRRVDAAAPLRRPAEATALLADGVRASRKN